MSRSLHVVISPCLIGYDAVAQKYLDDVDTNKNTLYYKLWIEANVGGSSPRCIRDFCNKNVGSKRSPDAQARWTKLFRKSCEMEIGFWDRCLKEQQSYEVVPSGRYIIRNVQTETTVLDVGLRNEPSVDGPPVVCNKRAMQRATQQWIFSLTSDGYTIQNSETKMYAGLSEQNSRGHFNLTMSDIPHKWYIIPSTLSGITDITAYQIIAATHQDHVVDLANGHDGNAAEVLAFRNYFGAGRLKGRNQAWILEAV